jgi:hypothetical protein
VPIDEHNVAGAAQREMERGGRAEAARADDDDIGPVDHRYAPLRSISSIR